MVKCLGPREAVALLGDGKIDCIDVRDPDDWAAGHVPGARNVPLAMLKAEPRRFLARGGVLFVCARGQRSLRAAELAEEAGLGDVYSLEGGTLAWEKAGLPIDAPQVPPAAGGAVEHSAGLPAPEESCGLPEPGLDAVVGANLRALRAQRSLSLDEMARMCGLSRSLLGQIELGKTAPSVSLVWKIAGAFDLPFSKLLATPRKDPVEPMVLRKAQAKRLASPDGRFSSRALYPLESGTEVEFYELFLAPHSLEEAQPHRAGTRENLIVTSGHLELDVAGQKFSLAKGDAILFGADVPHAYRNSSSEECWIYLVMTYAGSTS